MIKPFPLFWLLVTLSISFPAIGAMGQQTMPPAIAPTYYTDPENGFRVQTPPGWIGVNLLEVNQLDLSEDEKRDVLNIAGNGYETIAHFCPANTAEPVIGGGSKCPIVPAPITIGVAKYHFD